MAEEFLNINPPEPRGPEIEPTPPPENRLWAGMKSILIFLVLAAVVVGSFWISFQLGRRLLTPVKKIPEQKIEVPIPEPPASIKSLQRLQEIMSKEAAKKGPKCLPRKVARAKAPSRAKAAAAGGQYFKVQAGWFADKAKAQELGEKVKAGGFDVFIKKVGGGWRVQAGAYRTRSQAEALRRKLAGKGFDSTLIHE